MYIGRFKKSFLPPTKTRGTGVDFLRLHKMSLRRKSCNNCYQGRRNCDLGYPVCQRCYKSGKACLYTYLQPVPTQFLDVPNDDSTCASGSDVARLQGFFDGPLQRRDSMESSQFDTAVDPSEWKERILSDVPNMCGILGEVQPVASGTRSWQ